MRRSKGAVPLVATLLLITIVFATILVVYSYVSGATVLPDTNQQVGKMLEKLKTVEVKAYRDGQFQVFIMNTGSVDSVLDMFYVKDSSENTILAIPKSTSVKVNETVMIDFDPYLNATSPWSWYEIMGVTERGTKVKAYLYGYFTGAYELGEGPSWNETDVPYKVVKVTVNGTDVTTSELLYNMTYVDDNYFDASTGILNNMSVSHPASSFQFNVSDGQFNIPKMNLENLAVADGEPNTVQYEIKPYQSMPAFLSAIFNGNTINLKYPKILLSFIFDLPPARMANMNGTVQFYDWVLEEYVTSGNGFISFSEDDANLTSYNMYNFTFPAFDRGNLLGDSGEWSLLINITTDLPSVVKLDYLAVTEEADYINGLETILYYNLSNVNKTDVIRMQFSTTGIFPSAPPYYNNSYWYSVFNFDEGAFNYLGTIDSGPYQRLAFFENNAPNCLSFIGGQLVLVRISPVEDLPLPQIIKIDQSKLIVRQYI